MLPAGWSEYNDPASGNSYYHCAATGETTWTRPALPAGADALGAPPPAGGQMAAPQMQQQFGGNPAMQQPQLQQGQGGDPAWQQQAQLQQGQAGNPALQQQAQPAMNQWPQQMQPGPNQWAQQMQPGQNQWGMPAMQQAPAFNAMMGNPAQMAGYGQAGGQAAAGGAGRESGNVKVWFEEKGFGFITPLAGGDDCYCHRTQLTDGGMLTAGSTVQYIKIWDDKRNKNNATQVTGAAPRGSPPANGGGCGAGGGAGDVNAMINQAAQMADGGRQSGIAKAWFDDKGFGFITPTAGGDDCYVHRTQLTDGGTLVTGSPVQYIKEWDAKRNKFNATQVTGAVPTAGKGDQKGAANTWSPGGMDAPGGFGMAMGKGMPADSYRSEPYGAGAGGMAMPQMAPPADGMTAPGMTMPQMAPPGDGMTAPQMDPMGMAAPQGMTAPQGGF